MKDRGFEIIIGKQRGGKTFYTEAVCNFLNSKGKTILIYNTGRRTDFTDYEFITFLTIEETARLIYDKKGKKPFREYNRFPSMSYFSFRGETHHIKRFNFITKGCKLKMYRFGTKRDENKFFKALCLYVSNIQLVIDDARPVTMQKLSNDFTNMVSKRDHHGDFSTLKTKFYGFDLTMIYHDFDHLNKDIWSYNPTLTMFPTLRTPTGEKFSNRSAYELVCDQWLLLKAWTNRKDYNYDAFRINLEELTVKNIFGKDIKKINNATKKK